jgi:quinol monooxygenase YgiN
MQFTQHVVINAESEEAILQLFEDWQEDGSGGAPGFLGGRVLRFRDKPGRYVIQADFVSWEDAQENNDRPETQAWAARLMEIIDGEPKYENLDVLTEFGG